MKTKTLRCAVFASLCALAIPASDASAYELRPFRGALGFMSVHESLTYKSILCLNESPLEGQAACSDDRLGNGAFTWNPGAQVGRLTMGRKPVLQADLWDAVMWPDDPLHKVQAWHLAGITQFIVGMKRSCERRSNPSVTVAEVGLQCASHFGSLQFLHSMASRENETGQETLLKILEWASFLFQFAKGTIADDAPLCETLKSYGGIGEHLGPTDTFICKPDARGHVRTVGELFGFSCNLSPYRCEQTGTPRRHRISAIGALLHLIQDSYSQSHAQRGPCEVVDGRVVSRISSQPISQFYSYGTQDSHKHAEADKWPWPDFGGELPRGVTGVSDHPVLAGARILRLLEQTDSTVAVLRSYLADHVYGLGDTTAIAQMPEATSGACFKH